MSLPLERLEGKYEILTKLGEGGMGAVYKVRHVLLDEIRVVKVMRSALAGDQDLKARFLREARVATHLRHPNIAQLYDFTIDDDGTAYIVLEFIDGLTLEELLERHGPPPIGFALQACRQSLRALDYLHRQQFVHRDVSPDNLMLSRDVDGRPLIKLIDLGIAKTLEADGGGLTATGMFLGKVRYTSPEQLGTTVELDGRSDVYSFGIVLYELLTGQCPIEGTNPSAIIAGHLFRPPRPFDETDRDGRVPPELREIVMHALAKSREDRIRSARAFSQRLGRLQSQFPLSEEEAKGILDRLFAAVVPEPSDDSSVGTQDRLNEQFGAHPTPPYGENEATVSIAGRQTALREQDGGRRIPDAERGSKEARQVEMLIAGARKLAELGQDEAAKQQLEALRAIDPGNADLLALLREVEGREAERREAERAASVARAAERIGAEIEATRFQSAEHLLADAIATYGTADAFVELRQRLDRRIEESRRERVVQLLEEASRLGEAGRYDDALNELERVLQLDPGNRTAQTRIASFRDALERQVLERRRQEAAQEIEGFLEQGELDEAQRRLEGAVANLGAEGLLAELRQRLDELRCLQRLESLLLESRQSSERDDHRRAVEILEEAAQLAPGHAQVRELLDQGRRALERQEQERRLRAAVSEIEALLDAGDLEPAKRLLMGSIEEHGEADDLVRARRRLESARKLAAASAGIEEAIQGERWDEARKLLAGAKKKFRGEAVLAELGKRLEDEERRSVERAAKVLLDQARRKFGEEDFEAALADLRQAAELAPGNRDGQRLSGKVEKALEREKEKRQRALAIDQARVEITGLIDDGRLDEAGERLRAVKSLGKDPELTKLRRRLRQEEGRRKQQQKFETVLAEARKLYEARCFEAALKELEQARRIDGEDPRAAELGKRIEQAHARERAELAVEKTKIGEPDADATVRLDADRTVRLGAEGAALPDAEGTVRLDVDRTAPLDMDRTVQLRREPESRKEIRQATETRRAAAAPAEAKPREAPEPLPTTEPAVEPESGAATPAKSAAVTRLMPATPAETVAAAPSKPAWARIALPLAAACLLVFSLSFFLARSRMSEPTTAGTTAKVEPTAPPAIGLEPPPQPAARIDPAPAAVAPGTLVLTAIPWGQVTSIRDGGGQAHTLPADVYTPLMLSLPPGEYVIELRNEKSRQPATLTVRIESGREISELATFTEVSVDEFFASLGW